MLKKLGSLVFAALFAVLFGAGALMGGVLPLANTAKQAFAVRDWVQAEAQIETADLKSHRGSKGSRTYQATTTYRYTFGNRQFSGSRIGLSDKGSDNIGNWHQQWFERLNQAKENEQKLTVWVNPNQPEQALLDRNVRWPIAMFHLPFALLFSAVSLGATVVFICLLFNRAFPFGLNTKSRLEWSGSKRTVKQPVAAAWLFTFCWCGLSFPFAFIVWSEPAGLFARTLVSGFAVIGLFLLYGAISASITKYRER